MTSLTSWMPPQVNTESGAERRVGVEIELAGIQPETAAICIQRVFGGETHREHGWESSVRASDLGDFVIELDTSYLKGVVDKLSNDDANKGERLLEQLASDFLTKAAEQVVPWEIVSPPIAVSQLQRMEQLICELRNAGALGTRCSLRYAFGLHLNPELPRTDVKTILSYLRAFCCLYDWIADYEHVDLSRKLTTYIKHFSRDYILRIINPTYDPSLIEFMDDYLQANPSRNRSLDLLPLFAHIDRRRLHTWLDDPRVKARPTLHYRLPNCDIDNPDWNLGKAWAAWLQVEYLACDQQRLMNLCRRYYTYLQSFTRAFDPPWLETTKKWLQPNPHHDSGGKEN